MKDGYLIHRGYRASLDKGDWIWTKILKKQFVGKEPDTGKSIMRAKSGDIGDAKKLRVVTNAKDYDEAVKMLDRFLAPPEKKTKFIGHKTQKSIFDAIREAEQ